jgi:hypothetical protein
LLALIGFALMNIRLAQTIPAREPYRTSDTIILNKVIKGGGLVLKNDHWILNEDSVLQSLQQLAQDILFIKSSGTINDAIEFIKKNACPESVEILLDTIKEIPIEA